MAPVELPSHFVRGRDVVAVSTVAQNVAKYTKREDQAAVMAKQFRERIGLCHPGTLSTWFTMS